MKFTYWLRRMFSPRAQVSRAVRRGKSRPVLRRQYVPKLEHLEDRLAPATLMVTNTSDNVNTAGSLPYEINASVTLTHGGTGNDTIQFSSTIDGGTISLTNFVTPANGAGPSAFVISGTDNFLTIDGMTGLTKGITIERAAGAADFRLFDVANHNHLTLEGLTLSGGDAQGGTGGNSYLGGGGGGGAGKGGAIFNAGYLTILNSTLTGNIAQGGAGGAYDYNSTPNAGAGGYGGGGNGGNGGNPGGAGGAGAFGGGGGGAGAGTPGGKGGSGGYGGGNGGGSATYTIGGGGGGAGMGGAVFNSGGSSTGGSVNITNSTFYNNKAVGGAGGAGVLTGGGTAGKGLGGGVFNLNGDITVTNSTLSDNTAAQGGRDVFNLGYETTNPAATANINNSILGQSGSTTITDFATANDGSHFVPVNEGSNNLMSNPGTFPTTGVISNATNPLLSTLGNYGGVTQTLALLPGSPAINAGTSTGAPSTDQRGEGRVGNVDIGAFESQGFTIAATSGSGQSGGQLAKFANPLVATITANDNLEPVAGGQITFTAPASGASATLIGSPATISAGGTASVTAVANSTLGNYKVSAKASGITNPASFSLDNVYTTSFSALTNSQSIAYGTATITLGGHIGAGTDYPTGLTVSITLNGVVQNATVSNTGTFSATFNSATLKAGKYTVTYSFAGNGTFLAATDTSTAVTVTPASTSTAVTSNQSSPTYGQTVTFTATVTNTSTGSVADPAAPTGTVQFYIDGSKYSIPVTLTAATATTSTATITDAALTVAGSPHTIYAVYSNSDGNYQGSTAPNYSQAVGSVTPTFSVTSPTIAYGTDSITLGGQMMDGGVAFPTGSSVLITFNGSQQTATVDSSGDFSSPAPFNTANLNLDTSYPVTYAFTPGNNNFQSVEDTSTTVTVSQSATTTTGISAPTITYNANGSITVTVSSGAGTVSGNVDLTVDGANEGQKALSGGSVTYTVAGLNAGSHSLAASYAAQGNFAASSATGTLTVNPAATTTGISAPTITYNANGSITVTVGSGAGTVTGNVDLTVDGADEGQKALSGGSVTYTVAGLNAGSHSLAASYAAQGNFALSNATGTLTVNPAVTTTGISAPTITSNVNGSITVTVGSGASTVTGNVDLTVDGADEGQKALSGGSVTYTVAGLNAGSHSLAASYAAQGNFALSNATGTLTVIPPLTFSALTSPNFSYGQATTLLGGDIGSGTTYPTGSQVGITLNSVTQYATVQSNGSFSTNFSTTSLGVGAYTVAYNFPGNANFGAVTGTSTVTVTQAAPTFSNLSSQQISAGATSTPLGGHIASGTAYPTGENVEITVNGVTQDADVGSDGNFSTPFNTANLGAGSYKITYYYPGDANFGAVTDTSQTLTVEQGITPFAFDFATIGGARQAATLELASSNGTPTLEVVSGGNVVASQALSATSSVSITGEGNDSLTVDFTTPFSEPIQFNYNVAGNALDIIGGGEAGTYTPTAGVSGAGQVQVGSTGGSTIQFSGLASLAVCNLGSFTFTTPAGGNNVTIASPSAQVNSISGTSGGTAFVPVTFSSVTGVTIDTSENDTASSVDTVIIESSGLVASGLQNFTLTTGSGNSMLLDYSDSFSLPVSGGTFAFNGGSGTNTLVGPNPSIASNVQLTNVGQSIPVPVVVIPGFTASFATASETAAWFDTIGLPPSDLELDPLENTYADLVKTLESDGYVNGQTLFQAPWDWRLPVAPQNTNETIDGGMLDNLTATTLTGDGYQYGVDYLGTALVTAAQTWALDFEGRSLPALDVITHSTGGLIARAYVQSPSYGATLSAGQTLSSGGTLSSSLTLPKINDAVMMAPPNQGAAEVWNLLNNNFSADVEDQAVSVIVGASYDAVVAGGTITSPNEKITLASIMVNGQPSIQQFLNLYCPSLYDLLPTFPFLDTGSGPLTIGANGIQNNLLLELNDGLGLANPPANSDPNSFLDSPTNSLLGNLYIEYSSSQNTADEDELQPANTGSIVPLGSFFSETPNTTWYEELDGTANGDGTLTDTSTVGQFLDSPLLNSKVFLDELGGSVIHADIPSDPTALANMLSDLGQNDSSTVIDTKDGGFDPGTTLEKYLAALVPSNSGASLSYDGLTFDASNINVAYDNDTNVFTLTGQSSITIPDLGTIGIQLGGNFDGTQTQGLVMDGDNFSSLDATISGDLTVGGLTLHSDGLELTYMASSGDFEIQGGADFSLDGSTVNVTLGDGMNSGLVVQNGTLASLDMTVDSNIAVHGVTFTTQALNFTYDAAASTFTMTGTAAVALNNATNISVDFGGGTTTGLVITNGDLTSLDMAVTGTFTVDDVTVAATNLTFSYTAGAFALSGSASVATADNSLSLDVTFINSGLVIDTATDELTSLDMSVTSSFTLDGVTVAANNLTFSYAAGTFALSGSTSVSTKDDSLNLQVTFINSGLVITNGDLTSLDMSVTSSFTIDTVSFSTTDLDFDYTNTDGTQVFSLTGAATVAVTGIASLDVTFGYTTPTGTVMPGLVITNGDLTSLDMTVTSNISIDSVGFSTNGLEFQYTDTDATPVFSLTGTAAVTVGTNVANLSVSFVNQGMVITDDKLTSLDMSVTSSFSVGSVMFSTTGLTFDYTAATTNPSAPATFQMSGDADLTIGGGISTVDVSITNLDISGGSLQELDMSVTSSITVASVTFGTKGLTFVYAANTDSYELTGTASVEVGGISGVGGDQVSVTFANNGLDIEGGNLVSLDVSVTSDFQIGGVKFGTNGLEFSYTAATPTADALFELTGSAFLDVGGISGVGGKQISVTFGTTLFPDGLEIDTTDGELLGLGVSVTSSFSVGKVTFGTQDLAFTYTAATPTADAMFVLTGTAFVDIGGISGVGGDQVSVTFGDAQYPNGLDIDVTTGQLVSLDVGVTSSFKVGSVTFGTKDLNFGYTAAIGTTPETFQLTGSAFVDIGGIGGVGGDQVEVSFGSTKFPDGLVISDGNLVNLGVYVTTSFTVGRVTFGTNELGLNYTAATDTFNVTGGVFVEFGGIKGVGGSEVSATFVNNGLQITNGNFVSLDLSIDSSFLVGGVTFGTKDLEFSYVAATDTFQMTGTAFVDEGGLLPDLPALPPGVPGGGDNEIDVTFANNGLLITDGELTSLDVSVNGSFQIGSVTINATNLEFDYTAGANGSNGVFDLSGTAGISAFAGLASLNVTFGYTASNGTVVPGLVINTTTGALVSLNMSVTSTVGIDNIGFNGDLVFTYTETTDTFIMTGNASVTLPDVGSLNVDFGGTNPDGTQTVGLEVQDGIVTTFNMTVTSNLNFEGFSFIITNCVIAYTTNLSEVEANPSIPLQSLFTMTGDASLNLPDVGGVSLGSASLDFGGTSADGTQTQGIVVTNGVLTTFNMTASVDFTLAGFGIQGNLVASFAAAHEVSVANPFPGLPPITVEVPDEFELTGNASATFLEESFSVDLGGGGTKGLVVTNGKLASLDMTITGTFGISNVIYVDVSTTATYNASNGEFTLSGTGGLDLQVPSSLQSLLGDTIDLFSVGFSIVDIPGDNADSYVQFTTTIFNTPVGLTVNFNGDVSLNPGINILQGIKNTFDDIGNDIVSAADTVASWFGPLKGATVYYDANDDFDYANPASYANDPSAVTASDGSFHLAIPAGSTTGQIVVVGGVDQSTGLANAAILTAPLGATTITPFSTLVNDIEQQTGAPQAVAIAEVQQTLGLSPAIDPLAGDYIKQALAGDPNAASMFASDVQLTALSYQVDSLLSGAGGGTPASISTYLFKNLASTIAQSGGAPLDLSDPATVQALIQTTAASVGVSLDPTVAAGAATIVAGVNQYIAALPVTGSAAYLNQVVQAQVVAENTIAPLFDQVGAGTVSINTVVAQETGTPLATQIAAASIGSVDLDGPTIVIANQVLQPVGNGDPSTMQFSVYLATAAPLTQAVSVQYTTQDGTATVANGDYTPVSGTLTWLPGDTAPKTITVAVSPTSLIAPDKLFQVVLSNAVNANIEYAAGVGDIEYTDVATTTSLTSSTTSPTYGQAVTLTATVTNQDAALDAGTGSVTFYDGTSVLGTATLMNGVASFTTTALNSGTHNISATYTGQLELGEMFDPSNSAVVSVAVAPAPQTIDFGGLAEQTYCAAPILLNATASSGLPVTFSVLSGPAILVGGDVLTITGAGTVSIEADQAGDSNYQSAPPVVQSFTVDPATLTFTADDQAMTYGGTLPTLTGSFTGFVNGDDLDSLTAQPTLSTAGANSNVGAYAIDASGAAAPNYTISYVPGTLTITPAPLTITAEQSMVVGSAVPTLTASYSGLVNGDTPASLTTLPTLSTTATSASPIGFYDITAGGAVDPNYTISYVDGTLNVASAAPTITLTNSTGPLVYGQPVAFTATVSGDQGAATGSVQFQVDGVNFGPQVDLFDGSASLTDTSLSAGSYAITAIYTSDSNSYTDGSNTITDTVDPATLTFTADNQSMTYGGTLPTLTGSFTGFVNGDGLDSLTAQPTLSTVGANSQAGSYAIDASGAADPNYTISYVDGTLTITPAPLTITANDQSVVLGSAVPTLTASYSGLVNGDTSASLTTPPTLSTSPTAADSIGSYPITVTGAVDANYTISYVDGTLNVASAAPTITLTNSTGPLVYGQPVAFTATVSGDQGAATGSVQFQIDGVNFGPQVDLFDGSASLTDTALSAGSHAITAIYTSGSDNYTDGTSTITDTINPLAITITAYNQSTTYGTNDTSLDAGYYVSSGSLASGDEITSVALATSDPLSSSGNYDATAGNLITAGDASGSGGFNTNNYTISYAAGTLTVSQLGLSISGLTATKTYDGSTTGGITIGGSPTLNTSIAGDSVSINSANASAAFTDPKAGSGDKTVNFSGYALEGSDAANYSLTQPSITTGTIAKASSVTTTVGSGPFTYNGSAQVGGSGTVTGAGGLNTNATSLTYSANANGTGTADRTDAGTYYVTAHYAGDANHTASDGAAVAIVINKASSVTTTVGVAPFTYNGSVQVGGSGTVAGAGGLNTNATSLTYSANANGTGTADRTDAGTYYVTAHYAGDANHTASDGAAVAIVINKASSATTTVGVGPFTYNGSAQVGGSGTVTGAGGLNTSATSLTYSANANGTGTADRTDAGTYYVTAHYAGDANHTASDGAAVAIVINKASSATTTVGVGPFTYNGSAQIGGSGTVTGAGGLNTNATSLTYSANANGTGTADRTDAGTYYVTAHYAGDANHTASDGAAVAIVINKASSATTTVGVGPFTYNGSVQVGGSGTVTGAGGLNTNATSLTYSANANGTGTADRTDAGTYYVTAHYAGDANHTASDGAAVAIVINKASPKLTASAGGTAVVGTSPEGGLIPTYLTASATLGGYVPDSLASSITFTLYSPTNTVVATEVVSVSGNGTYTTPNGYTPSIAGTYQWVASYSGDSNNNGVSTTKGNTPEVAVATGNTIVGNSLYLVGGNSTNDQLVITATGTSQTGSTGINVNGQLNKVNINNQTYSQAFTTIYVIGYAGNDNFQLAGSLTIATVICAGNGNDNIQLDNGSNTVTVGNGNDNIQPGGGTQGGNGNNTITVGNGNDNIQLGNGNNTIIAGAGNDNVQLGNGNNSVMLGNGNDNVQAGNGNNIVTSGNGNDNVQLGTGNNTIIAGTGNDNVQLGNGNNIVTAGNGNDNAQLGNGNSTVTLGNGNDNAQLGAGNNTVTLGNGNDNVQAGNGNNTVTTGNGNDNVQVGNGNNVVVTGNGNNNIQAGNGDNLIAAGLGQHNVQVGNGRNILIDGSVQLENGVSLSQILDDWIKNGSAAYDSISMDLSVTLNTKYANNLQAGSGLDWFWAQYTKDHLNNKKTDLLTT